MKNLLGKAMSLGCVMIDVAGYSLTQKEKELLLNPLVAGVILFSRNFTSVEQLQELTSSIHNLRHPKLLIAVDHEGGRVQRFKIGFSEIPPMAYLGKLYNQNPEKAMQLTQDIGWIIASELLSVGIDFSFTPVLDLDYGSSSVIGDRAFHSDFNIVSKLSFFLMKGLQEAGMPAVGKHFPGHGYIKADTHLTKATDSRTFEEIKRQDLQPFIKAIKNNIEAIMPSHIIYPQVDSLAAGFSNVWLQDILRNQYKFTGAIISDDLSMQAALDGLAPEKRALRALEAGCDLILFCNSPETTEKVLNNLNYKSSSISHARLIRLHGHIKHNYDNLHKQYTWQAKQQKLSKAMEQLKQETINV